jgi:hypothetical protein
VICPDLTAPSTLSLLHEALVHWEEEAQGTQEMLGGVEGHEGFWRKVTALQVQSDESAARILAVLRPLNAVGGTPCGEGR